ncbi:MAG: tetratricopeptide repeat protein [Bacteroidota bacterium]
MKKRLVSLMIVSVLFMTIKLFAQTPEELFNNAFPKLGNELNCSDNKTSLNAQEVADFRDVLKKLTDADDDLIAFNAGALTDENFKVFTNKNLKKADTEKLSALIANKRNKIIAYMGTKTKYGADDVECKKYIALYEQNMKQKNYKDAYNYWGFLFRFYPMSRKSIYSKASKLFTYKYNKATKEDKSAWVDTLMMVYDQRIKYFGNDKKYPKGFILGRKGKDLVKYRKNDVEEAYGYLKESVKLQGVKSEDAVLLIYMQATEGMFVNKKAEADVVVDNYSLISDLLVKRLAVVKNKEKTQKAINGVDDIFSHSDAATCKGIIGAYDKKYKANPDDVELLEKIAKILDDKDCTDSQLYFDVIDNLNKKNPSAFTSYGLANMSLKKEKYADAAMYLKKAIELETSDSLKAKYYYKQALVSNKMGQKQQARSYANKAISLRKDYGAPYILIATMYASSGCKQMTKPEGELSRIAYWVAVDKLIQAKNADPSVAKDANKLIGMYSGNYPNSEDAFFFGVTKGTRVTVGCWINESTTARF